MKFDLSSLIITIVAFLAFVIPVSIDQLSKIQKKKTLSLLTESAKKYKFDLNKIEIIQGSYGFGLDSALRKLLYINNSENKYIEEVISLNDFSKCSIHENMDVDENSKFKSASYLKLYPKNSSHEIIELELFKTKKNLAASEEEIIAKKIVKSINKLI